MLAILGLENKLNNSRNKAMAYIKQASNNRRVKGNDTVFIEWICRRKSYTVSRPVRQARTLTGGAGRRGTSVQTTVR